MIEQAFYEEIVRRCVRRFLKSSIHTPSFFILCNETWWTQFREEIEAKFLSGKISFGEYRKITGATSVASQNKLNSALEVIVEEENDR